MPDMKATDVLAIRQLVRERGAEVEQAFLARLSAEIQDQYRLWVATEWIPLATAAEILRAGTDALYPHGARGLRQLGEAVAQVTFNGIYRAFLKTPTPAFFTKRFVAAWHALYNRGIPAVENVAAQRADLLVKQFPELSPLEREYLCGYWAGIFKLAGAQNVMVLHEDHYPMEWRWTVRWE